MKQNTILLILFGVILIYYLCKSTREGVEDGTTEPPTSHECPGNDKRCHTNKETGVRDCDAGYHAAADPNLPCIKDAAEEELAPDPAVMVRAAGGVPTGEHGGGTDDEQKIELGPELLDKIKELEETITKLKFQTKRAKLQGQNIVAVDKLDMGKLSMDLFNWQKLNKKSNVDVNLILGDHIKNSAKETSVKHIIANPKKEKSCDPVADEKEQEPPVKYKGYPVFTKPEFPRTQKYELPEGAQAGDTMKKPLEKADVNTGKPRPYNTESYDQKADTGIEKSH